MLCVSLDVMKVFLHTDAIPCDAIISYGPKRVSQLTPSVN